MFSKIIIGVLLFCMPIMQSFAVAQTNVLQQSQKQISTLISEIKQTNETLDVERAILERHQISLDEARNQLLQTRVELETIKRSASNESAADMREIRRISERLMRRESKVQRYVERENDSLETVAELEHAISVLKTKLSGLQADVARLRKSSKISKSDTDTRERQNDSDQQNDVVNKTEAMVSVGMEGSIARKVQSVEQGSPKAVIDPGSGSWPTIDDASMEDIAYAKARLQNLRVLRESGKIDSTPLPVVEIEARRSFGSAEMQYIGEDLYSLVEKVGAGRQNFRLFNQEYWFAIPEKDNNAFFRILFDVSSLSQPKLIIFKEGLLNQ